MRRPLLATSRSMLAATAGFAALIAVDLAEAQEFWPHPPPGHGEDAAGLDGLWDVWIEGHGLSHRLLWRVHHDGERVRIEPYDRAYAVHRPAAQDIAGLDGLETALGSPAPLQRRVVRWYAPPHYLELRWSHWGEIDGIYATSPSGGPGRAFLLHGIRVVADVTAADRPQALQGESGDVLVVRGQFLPSSASAYAYGIRLPDAEDRIAAEVLSYAEDRLVVRLDVDPATEPGAYDAWITGKRFHGLVEVKTAASGVFAAGSEPEVRSTTRGTLIGPVVDAATGRPLLLSEYGVTVVGPIRDPRPVTVDQLAYRFEGDLPAGTYEVVVTPAGERYRPLAREVRVAPGETRIELFAVPPAPTWDPVAGDSAAVFVDRIGAPDDGSTRVEIAVEDAVGAAVPGALVLEAPPVALGALPDWLGTTGADGTAVVWVASDPSGTGALWAVLGAGHPSRVVPLPELADGVDLRVRVRLD